MALNKATMVKPRPARERAVTSPAKMITRVVKPAIAAMIDETLYDDSAKYDDGARLAFLARCAPSHLVQRPGDDKWDQAIKQRREVIPVGEESDSFLRIGDFEET